MSKISTKAAVRKLAVNIPHISKKGVLSIFMVIIWVAASILAISAFTKPGVVVNKIIINEIEEKTAFDYTGLMKKSTLYPEGGYSEDQVLFTKLTDKLIIKLDSVINAKAPVRVEGNIRVTYSLVAGGMWQREFVLIDTKKINVEGTANSLIQEEFEFDLAEINNYIDKIEEETEFVRGDYMLVLRPRILGLVFQSNGEKIHEINTSLEIPFELNSQYLRYAAESPDKVFTYIKAINGTQTVPQSINMLGLKIPVSLARWIFSITSAVCILVMFLLGSRQNARRVISEVEIIDKKYRSKIMEITDDLSEGYPAKLGLKSFKDLQRISDEKDEPILKYTDPTKGLVFYYVTGSSNIYYYTAMLP